MVGLFVGQCRVELQNDLADHVLVCGIGFIVPVGHPCPKISRVPPSGVNCAQEIENYHRKVLEALWASGQTT